MGPYPQYGWPEVPMQPGPPMFYPFPPPVPMYHSGGPVQAAGQYGFPPPPPQVEPQTPTAHGPESQNHAHSGQASLPLAHNSPAPDPQTEPSNNCSVQTKPPSAEEAFPGKPSPTRSPAASIHSSTENMSIRVRLPVQPADTEPEKSPVRTPSRNKLRRDSPVRQLTFGDIPPPAIAVDTEPKQCPVLIEDHNKIRGDSPVRRITFGDFAPPEEQTENVTNGSSQANEEPAPSNKKEGDNTREVFEWQFNPSSSSRNSGDIRLEPDYTGTVIHRKPRRQRVPWEEDRENGSYGFWNHYHGSYPAHPSPHGANGMLHPPPLPHHYPHPMYQGRSRPSDGHFPPQGFHGPQQTHFKDSPPKQWNGHHSPPAPGVQAPESGSPLRPDEPGPTKPQKKKKFNKHKNKSGPNSQTQSRSTTPLPQAASGNATPKDNGTAAPGAVNLNGSANSTAKGKGKGNRKAATRSTNPVPPEPTAEKHSDNGNGNGGGEDIYNATPPPPKKNRGTGCVPASGADQAQAQKIPNDDEAGDHKAVKRSDLVKKTKGDGNEPNGVVAVVVEEGGGGDTNKGANDKKDEEQGGDFRAGAGGSLRVPRNRKWNKNAAKRMDVREFFKEEN
ncbi:hypothetical protein NEMBOFW57_001847 [Staphylotrichum longicolle]|uniref:Uncharacterized protein n=1 Tax=Staphylotrichum longicolle TaxID=669026 RepID=A0AAD4I207_9PEZI|nr:hypothetical protein NEMBOFW57_001847 [Staphylotrichum longicolle]